MRLRTRLALALVGVALVLSVTALAGFSLYREAVVAQERSELQRTSESVATQIGVIVEERARTVELWAKHDDVMSAGTTTAERSQLRTFVRTTSFSGASVIAANGTMLGIAAAGLTRAEERALVGESFANRTYFRRAMTGETYVSDPVAAESGFRIVTISTPIYRNGRVVGTLNGAFHLARGDTFGSVRAITGPAQRVRVFDDSERVYDTGNGSVPASALVANATVPETDWVVSLTQTRATIESRLRTVTILQGGAFLVILVSMTAFGGWLYREYLGNVRKLHEGFSALADGEYGTTLSLSGSAEWEALRDHFNEVSTTLGRRRTEVTVLNRVLRHNLRNAMTVVVGNADRIAAESDDESVRAQAEAIGRRGESLLDLADRARRVDATLQSDRDDAPPRRVDAILEEVTAALREEFPAADIRLSVDATAQVPNGALLEVAFDELVRNAVVHGGDDPVVEIDARADGDAVVVSVSDDGPGLPAVERRLLTETFVETPTEHGSGLGLWMVSWLVTRAEGDIDVAVDDGTTVTVTVPQAAP